MGIPKGGVTFKRLKPASSLFITIPHLQENLADDLLYILSLTVPAVGSMGILMFIYNNRQHKKELAAQQN